MSKPKHYIDMIFYAYERYTHVVWCSSMFWFGFCLFICLARLHEHTVHWDTSRFSGPRQLPVASLLRQYPSPWGLRSKDPHGTQKRSEIPCVWTSETWDLRISMVHVWSSTYELTWKHVIADDRNISNISPLASLLVISVKLALWHPMVLTPFQAAMHLSSVVPCRDMIPLFSIRAMETKLWFGTSTG